jgi:hypothetical protein
MEESLLSAAQSILLEVLAVHLRQPLLSALRHHVHLGNRKGVRSGGARSFPIPLQRTTWPNGGGPKGGACIITEAKLNALLRELQFEPAPVARPSMPSARRGARRDDDAKRNRKPE